jgi:hypothetical protein
LLQVIFYASCAQAGGNVKLTFSIDDQVAQNAHETAQKMGRSLDQLAIGYLEQLARSTHSSDQWAHFEARCLQSSARLDGWKFNRNQDNER